MLLESGQNINSAKSQVNEREATKEKGRSAKHEHLPWLMMYLLAL